MWDSDGLKTETLIELKRMVWIIELEKPDWTLVANLLIAHVQLVFELDIIFTYWNFESFFFLIFVSFIHLHGNRMISIYMHE